MKKKTRSKSRNSLLLPFFLTVFVCLIGASTNSWLFYNSFFRALTKLNEQPIATITFKYKTAQRKFLDRVVWDRLRQDSPVYNGDTIHTASLSEATIWFNDGNVMELMENTMAQVFLRDDNTAAVELEDGYANVDSSDSENGLTLSSNGMQVAVKSGASLSAGSSSQDSAAGSSGVLSVQMIKGNASIQNADGTSMAIKQGEELNIGTNGSTALPSKPALSVYAPLRNEKIMYHKPGEKEVSFRWNDEIQNTILKISQDKNFNDVLYSLNSEGLTETQIKLSAGTYYWQLDGSAKDSTTEEAINDGLLKSGKIQVIQSLPPVPIAPAQNYSYGFRSRNPAVRLIWTESPYATTYKLEISKNASMANPIIEQRTSTTSSIISSLGAGSYYWRVTPYYTLNKEGFAAPSEIQKFNIEKKGELSAPELLIPAENAVVNIEENAKPTSFSWRNDIEAIQYTVVIADNQSLRNPAVKAEVMDNYYTLDNSLAKLKEGHWYWAITMKDTEGNTSPVSETRSFYTMRGIPEQHTIEPADGYNCALALLPDTKFTWKRNIPDNFVSKLEIATDSNFNNIVYSEAVNSTSLKGINLNLGSYYWRLKSLSTTDDTQLITPPKSLNILGPLEASTLSAPGNRAIARETIPFNFKWTEVAGADYYKLIIFNAKDNSIVYENVVYDTEDFVDMYNPESFIDKEIYRWQIQAYSNEVPGIASRRTGRLTDSSFQLIKLRPVEITAPKKGAKFNGVDAILNPSYASWSTVDSVAKAQLVITKTDGKDKVVLKVPTDEQMARGNTVAPSQVLLDTDEGLRPGDYEIVVYAETLDGIDISNTDRKYKGTFTVLPVEPLEGVTSLTSTPENLNAEYLRNLDNPRTITLTWQKVKDATDYMIEIKDKKNKVLFTKLIEGKTSYEIDFLKVYEENRSAFAKGTFTWSVYALRRIDSNKDGTLDKVLQEGPSTSSTFSTDIPSPTKTKAKGAKNPYGN